MGGYHLRQHGFAPLTPSTTSSAFDAPLELLELHLKELEDALSSFAEKQTKWHRDRRSWELQFIKWLYTKHPDYLVNGNKITERDIEDADTLRQCHALLLPYCSRYHPLMVLATGMT
ncbi:uncharacterized protein CDV56_107790 [Aspergillus thermomutatus]|uniref:Uncharacterized protein n=1 Tax=Aspergillus thermomutatus TaxID=41047 RepID=A0A397H8R1_ASPTH|nr:uncharacterized protein CDV56_107790 [Aspergillus thermomutatus]RHZ59451.1 hypothetical protein CDV56_107790 [Aspergillus thermomutatus]